MGSRPSRAIQLNSAVQRYTVYSYTSLYTIHPLQHPSAAGDEARGEDLDHGALVRTSKSRRDQPPPCSAWGDPLRARAPFVDYTQGLRAPCWHCRSSAHR
jgi:hypothetical protein